MIEQFAMAVNAWITAPGPIALLASFIWGMISMILSPCHLAAIPLMVAYVGGQNIILPPRRAARYAVLFSGGIFLSIVIVGTVCALLGRMLGDIGPWWTALVGLLLIWVGFGMFKDNQCRSGMTLNHRRLRGLSGSFLLGLAYGLLSGACTFGFIAPILGIISVQQQIITGLMMILLFAAGLCLPLVAAGTFSGMLGQAMAGRGWQRSALWFRRVSALVIITLGGYFLAITFF